MKLVDKTYKSLNLSTLHAFFVWPTHQMTRPRYTLGHHVLLEALFILLYAVPRLRKLRFILLLLPIAYIFFFMRLPDATPYPYFDMALGNRFGTILLLSSADFLLLRRDPQEEYRSTEDKRDISRLPFHKRLWWALQVWGNPRGVGWTHQVQSGLPSRPTETSRSRFILKLGREVLTSLILYDINKAFLRRNPFFDPRTVDSIASFNGLWGHRGLWRIHAAIGYSFNLRLEMNHTHKIVALGCLLAGFTQPQDWPDLFGPLSDTYTLGGFWGFVRLPTVGDAFLTKSIQKSMACDAQTRPRRTCQSTEQLAWIYPKPSY